MTPTRRPRLPLTLCAAALLFLPSLRSTAADSIAYDFDDALTATGPDTFQIFEHASGTVELSNIYRHSGNRSVKVTDAASSNDFPEMQGYFPVQSEGQLAFAFHMLVADTKEELNVALAGPAHFQLTKDGIAFWLIVRDGYFFHMSDGMPKRLGPAASFLWYGVRVDYDISRGTYRLEIRDEFNSQPPILVESAANAPNQPASAVNMFSFIGDLADNSNVDYYIDDVVLDVGRSQGTSLVAPGRRKLFVEYWRDFQKLRREQPVCLPALSVADFGLSLQEIDAASRSTVLQLADLAPGDGRNEKQIVASKPADGVVLWHRGCFALANEHYDDATQLFERAAQLLPQSRLIALSKVLSRAGAGRWDAVDRELALIYPTWWGDERWVAAQGMIALRRQDYPKAEDLLAPFNNDKAGRWLGAELTTSELQQIRTELGTQWWAVLRSRLLIEQRFYLYIWQNQLAEAAAFATAMRERLTAAKQSAGLWWEWEGNIHLLMNDPTRALDCYLSAFADNVMLGRSSTSVAMKLSDVYFVLGDARQEKRFREIVYGTLD